ncbi:MAG: cytochrome c-type biogenesis CcmF C-terminal domain-containing protein, partial [Comamonadaceae bacterium]|nr:cytochrome c-type biogenesis CcmF C-terminal domain-containing protein [Comamonadaceae bacterium]
SWWAYYELGWGGWWFWDPVESASFMPWLALAALAHTLAAREGRRTLPHWTAMLAIGAFMLALLGLFLVRSGVITSVHAFATDPRRGVFLLALMAAFLLGAMGLYARHAVRLTDARAPLGTALASRETAILLNNLLLTVACASVLLGTLYPLALDALRMGKISVGPPYFNAVIGPLFLALLALLIPVNRLRWGQGLDAAARRALGGGALALTVLAALLWAWLRATQGRASVAVALSLALAVGVAAGTLRWAAARWRHMTAAQWGMSVAHLGVAVFAAGVAMVGGYGVERDVRLSPAATADGASAADTANAAEAGAQSQHIIGGCALHFDKVQPARGPNYAALAGHFTLRCPGEPERALVAEKRDYPGSSMPMTESAIRWGLTHDIYVALGEPLQATPYGAWSVRVQHKPLMRWVWGGVVLMALGALLAAGGRRYRPRPAAQA